MSALFERLPPLSSTSPAWPPGSPPLVNDGAPGARGGLRRVRGGRLSRRPLRRTWASVRAPVHGARREVEHRAAERRDMGGATWPCGTASGPPRLDACATETTGAARGCERTCEAISLRRHCPDQVDGGRRLAFQLAGLSAFRLPRPSRRPTSMVHPLGRGHQGPRSHSFMNPWHRTARAGRPPDHNTVAWLWLGTSVPNGWLSLDSVANTRARVRADEGPPTFGPALAFASCCGSLRPGPVPARASDWFP